MNENKRTNDKTFGHMMDSKLYLVDTETKTDSGKRIKLNIRGTKFEASQRILQAFPETLLANLDQHSEYWDAEHKEYFFNRDPDVFNSVLNFYTLKELHVPKHICGAVFRREIDFWKVSRHNLSECCWRSFYQIDEDMEVLADLRKVTPHVSPSPKRRVVPTHQEKEIDSISYRLWVLIDDPKSSTIAKAWHSFYLVVVAISTLAFFLGSLESLRTDLYLSSLDRNFQNQSIFNIPNWKLRLYYIKDPVPTLLTIELLCLIVFTVELVLNFMLCPDKKKFFLYILNVFVIINVFFMWLSFLFEFWKGEMVESTSTAVFYMCVRFLTALRVLLFLRIEKHFSAFRVLLFAIRSSLWELLLLSMTFFVATVIFACAIFYAEIFDEDTYDNMFISMWWAVVTMTTVGYGDYAPTTTIGYLVGVVCAVFGLLILAMPVAIIASNFSEYYTKNKDRLRHIRAIKEQDEEKS